MQRGGTDNAVVLKRDEHFTCRINEVALELLRRCEVCNQSVDGGGVLAAGKGPAHAVDAESLHDVALIGASRSYLDGRRIRCRHRT
jgi:hypothetical protein